MCIRNNNVCMSTSINSKLKILQQAINSLSICPSFFCMQISKQQRNRQINRQQNIC